MKRLLGMLLCGILVFSACGQEKSKEPVYETLDAANEAHLERCPEERLEDVLPVAEDVSLAVYSEAVDGVEAVEKAEDVYAIVRYLVYLETEDGFVLKEETQQYALQNASVSIDSVWLDREEPFTLEITAEAFPDDPYAEEQPSTEGYDGFYRQENGWFGVRVEVSE